MLSGTLCCCAGAASAVLHCSPDCRSKSRLPQLDSAACDRPQPQNKRFPDTQGGYGQGQGMATQAPQGGFSSQNGSPFGSMTAGTAGTPPLAHAPPSSGWGGAQQQQGMSQQPPRAPTRKEAAAVHDPFAALTGQHQGLASPLLLLLHRQCKPIHKVHNVNALPLLNIWRFSDLMD